MHCHADVLAVTIHAVLGTALADTKPCRMNLRVAFVVRLGSLRLERRGSALASTFLALAGLELPF